MNKRGFIFVISSVIIIAVLLLVFLTFDQYSYSDKSFADQRRLDFGNDFVRGFNQDLERAIRIASFRSLIALEEYIAISGQFLNNTEAQFAETVYNGTINGVPAIIMTNSSIVEYLNRINVIGQRFGLEVSVSVDEILLSQSNPWYVNVVVVANVSVFDVSGFASWTFSEAYKSEVPIANLRDPLYAVHTQNRFYNTIRQYSGDLSMGDPVSNIETLMGGSLYVASEFAPSFIQRFSNNVSPSPAGIESLVNIMLISDQDIPVYANRVKIDYIYFNNLASDKRCDFDGVNPDYKLVLPSNRLSMYYVDGLNPSSSCP
ncbi:hypothetical protein KO361_03310 [Candidatus Woesearchaeota archaeon]|nr:hypothetical protein [Candidatus Woesearchaeota archaeon]